MAKKAFDTKVFTGFVFDPKDLVVVGIDCPAEDYPHLYDERCKDSIPEGFIRSIMTNGVETPPTIVKIDDKPIVEQGRKRVMAARIANERFEAEGGVERVMVRVVTKRAGEEADHFSSVIAENELRFGDGMLRKADKAKKLLALNCDDYEATALAFNVSVTAVKQWMKLHDCCAAVRKAVEKGQISASAASKLAGLSVEEQKVKLDEMLDSGDTTVAATSTSASSGPKRGKKYWRNVVKLMDEAETYGDLPFGIALCIGDTNDMQNEDYVGLNELLEKAAAE